ncbi:TetR/AcrR family transcriptional regulator [Paracoccus albus]|uniref:TetR/AcrR family transcriptional regulator n=1 Tax=Paracoccus albus TaxID=3017784 RepID=UPI003EBAFF6C
MRDGYSGASVDDIAREAAVSKATLYNYFPDKRLMFDAVFRDELDRLRIDGSQVVGIDLPIEQVLRFIGHLIASQSVSEFSIRALRLAIAEASRFPDLAAEYYRVGPASLRKTLAARIVQWQEDGVLSKDIEDVDLAADSFICLCCAGVQCAVLLKGRTAVDDATIRRTVDNAVAMFLSQFGAKAV